jgi:hypothetical protein
LANDGGIGSGGLNVTQHNLTPNDLMALSQRHSREYSLLEYTDGTRRLYAGPVNGWEVSSPIGQGIRRRMHTHPGFDNFTPSVADMESLIHHRAAGGGGQVEVIFRQSGTGRTLTLQMNERVALETLADLAQAGLYLPTDPVVAQRLLPILQGRLGGP